MIQRAVRTASFNVAAERARHTNWVMIVNVLGANSLRQPEGKK
jgi:hypothetical protein